MRPRCLSLQQRPQAIALGAAFAKSFAANTSGLGKGEIALFRAMQKSLTAVANQPHLVVEEYHGAGHQVTFRGVGGYSRTKARCELSDLLVVVYDRQNLEARLSYIQAKSERVVPADARGIEGSALAANLEQWDLLSRRPSIAAALGPFGRSSTFNPPADLLSGAQLCSVGAFAFFLHGPRGVDICYAAGCMFNMAGVYRQRSGRLLAPGEYCCCHPLPECLSAYGNAEFGAFLFGLMIGTPILQSGKPVRPQVCSWLAAQIRGFAAQTGASGQHTNLTNELAEQLDPDRASPAENPNVGAASLLIFGLGAAGRRKD